MEAFESHVRLRHGHRAAIVRPSELKKVEGRLQKDCRVNIDKKSSNESYNSKTMIGNSGEMVSTSSGLPYKREISENLSTSSSLSNSSSNSLQSLPPPQRPPSSRSKTPTPDKELFLPSSNSSSSSNSLSSTPVGHIIPTPSMPIALKPTKVTDSNVSGVLDIEQPMEIDDIDSNRQSSLETLVSRSIAKAAAEVAAAQTATGWKSKFTSASEEADSTTPNNVISIPDTEPLPHAMSTDLMAMVGEASAADSTTQISSNTICDQSGLIKSNQPVSIKLNPRNDSILLAPAGIPPTNLSAAISAKSSVLTSALSGNVNNLASLPHNTPSTPSPTRLKTIVPSNTSSPVSSPATTKNSPGKKQPGSLVAGSGGNPSLMRSNSKLFREYHPDKHCGVWDSEAKRHCTRALTCKSHSVLLKRKIAGRSKNFDELVSDHKRAQAAAQAAAKEQQEQQQLVNVQQSSTPQTPPTVSVVVSGTQSAPQPIFGNNNPALQQNNNIISVQPTITNIQQNTIQPTIVQHPNQIRKSATSSPPIRKVGGSMIAKEVDENIHYTVDHPKPLAVCTFGGRRIGGLLVADRSQFLTRKLVRVAITAGGIARLGIGGGNGGPGGGNGVSPGFHRIRPRVGGISLSDSSQIGLMKGGGIIKRTQSAGISARNISCGSSAVVNNSGTVVGTGGNYLLNYNLSSNIKRQLNNVNVSAGISTGNVNLTTLQPGGHITGSVPESFKTDIQDFKGGIKFELGRKIKHILPSGSEVSK